MTLDAPPRSLYELGPLPTRLDEPTVHRVTPKVVPFHASLAPDHRVIAGWALLLLVFFGSLVLCLTPSQVRFHQETPVAGPTSLAQAGMTPEQLPLLVTSSNDTTGSVLEAWLSGSEADGYSVLDAKSYQRHGRHHASHKKPLPAKIVHLNAATLAQLRTLPGVGPKMAMRILAYRKALGGQFSRIEQLLDVKGIGPKTFAKLARFCQL